MRRFESAPLRHAFATYTDETRRHGLAIQPMKRGGIVSPLRWIALCVACCASYKAFAQPNTKIDDAALQIIRAQFPKARVDSTFSGTLDDSGNRYLAAVINDYGNASDRLVLLRYGGADWRLVVASKSWQWTGYRQSLDVEIKSKTVLLSMSGPGSFCSWQTEIWKFLERGDQFPLAGMESRNYGFTVPDGDDRITAYERGKSINHLSGQVIDWCVTGNADLKSYKYGDIGRNKKRIEKAGRFVDDRQWNISNFDLDDYYNWEDAAPHLCGLLGQDDQCLRKCP